MCQTNPDPQEIVKDLPDWISFGNHRTEQGCLDQCYLVKMQGCCEYVEGELCFFTPMGIRADNMWSDQRRAKMIREREAIFCAEKIDGAESDLLLRCMFFHKSARMRRV